MERINYSELIQQILTNHTGNHYQDETEVQLLFDTTRHHYQVLHLGWDGYRRVYGCIIHADIKDGKIWIQEDGTEEGVANELLEAGVPKSDIVLAFHPPYKRELLDFGKD